MTEVSETIHRRDDGSIDFDFYRGMAKALRDQERERIIRSLFVIGLHRIRRAFAAQAGRIDVRRSASVHGA